jgi:hypothetical protein
VIDERTVLEAKEPLLQRIQCSVAPLTTQAAIVPAVLQAMGKPIHEYLTEF